MSDFLRTELLPRIDALEAEFKALRNITWPVCQALLEMKKTRTCEDEKRKYMKHVFKDEGVELLKRKAEFMNHDRVILDHELRGICNKRLVSSFSEPILRAREPDSDRVESR